VATTGGARYNLLEMTHRSRGFTFAELMVVVTIMMVLVGFGVPRYHQAVEQSRVDIAGANMVMIWTAQRMYWVSHSQAFATSLAQLTSVNEKLLDPNCAPGSGSDDKYDYAITAGGATFTATATRKAGDRWSGTLTIDQTGTLAGTISDGVSITLEPSRYALGL